LLNLEVGPRWDISVIILLSLWSHFVVPLKSDLEVSDILI